MTEHPKCDQCGAPATTAVRDAIETEPNEQWKSYAPFGGPRYGCATHPVQSETYERFEKA